MENDCKTHGFAKDEDGEELYLMTCVHCLNSLLRNRQREISESQSKRRKNGK